MGLVSIGGIICTLYEDIWHLFGDILWEEWQPEYKYFRSKRHLTRARHYYGDNRG